MPTLESQVLTADREFKAFKGFDAETKHRPTDPTTQRHNDTTPQRHNAKERNRAFSMRVPVISADTTRNPTKTNVLSGHFTKPPMSQV